MRLFIDDGTNANLLMLLSCCKSDNYLEGVISCNGLPHKHGYCKLLNFIGSFLRTTELRKLLSMKNIYSGRTCLNIAAIAGNLCQMKVLLEMGMFYLCKLPNGDWIVDWLIRLDSFKLWIQEFHDFEVPQLYLINVLGASLNTFDDLGYSPLHYIIRKPRKDMVKNKNTFFNIPNLKPSPFFSFWNLFIGVQICQFNIRMNEGRIVFNNVWRIIYRMSNYKHIF